jgi:hypothetical protein
MGPQFFCPSSVFRTLRQRSVTTTLGLLTCLMSFQTPVWAAQFKPAVNYPVGRDPISIAVGDFNGDGVPDLATANQGASVNEGAVSVLIGNGDGTFKTAVDYGPAGGDPDSVVAGDFNGDGKLDLAVLKQAPNNATEPGQLTVLLGNGDGTFRTGVTYDTGNFARSVAVGDVNGDGKLDLAVASSSGTSIFLGNGDGTFKTSGIYYTGITAVLLVDLNHDGKLDLAVTNQNAGTISISLGNGDGTFGPSKDYAAGAGAISVAVGDFNQDGNPDLVIANASSPDNGTGGTTVAVLLGNGDGTFKALASYPAGPEPTSVAVGDFNKDGKLDLIVALFDIGEGNSVSLLLGNGDGTFQPPVDYMAGTGPVFVLAADLNHDGLLDVVAANSNSNDVSVLLNATVTSCTTRPEITGVFADPDELWPPNGKLVDVFVGYKASSSCGGTPACKLKVSSNDSDDRDDSVILDAHHVKLRAVRSRGWERDDRDRTYTITIKCVDSSGNTGKARTTVKVGRRRDTEKE